MYIRSNLIYAAAISLFFSACDNLNLHEAQNTDNHQHKSSEIIIEVDDQKTFGITTQQVNYQKGHSVIHATGVVSNDISSNSVISASTNGIITLTPAAIPGAYINKGTILARVSAQNTNGGDSNAAARARLSAAKAELDRIKPLLPDGIVTRREYEAALAEYESAKAGYSSSAASGVISVPMNGRISQVLAKSGEYVTTGSIIATISGSTSKILRIDVPEKFRREITSITTANIRKASSDEWISLDSIGEINPTDIKISPDATTGYFSIYCQINDPYSEFFDGSIVEVAVISKTESEENIVIPRKSITEQQGNYFVYVKTGEHSFEKRAIEPGESDGIQTAIKSGLRAGDEVVVSGTAMVRLAANRNVVPEGHSHNH